MTGAPEIITNIIILITITVTVIIIRITIMVILIITNVSTRYEERQFQSEMHVRFHSSVETSTAVRYTDDPKSETFQSTLFHAGSYKTSPYQVRTYLWPALREGRQGPVVHKADVIP